MAKPKKAKAAAPRQYTEEEIKHAFMKKVWAMLRYWQTLPNPHGDRMEGFAFSLLAEIDGCGASFPGFLMVPNPHETDKDYAIEEGRNWFPQVPEGVELCDIAGTLHDSFHVYDPKSPRYDPKVANAPALDYLCLNDKLGASMNDD